MTRRSDAERAELWRERVARHGRSGQSTAEFCEFEGVSVASFYAWRRKLALTRPRPAKPAPSAFQQLVVSESAAAVSVRLPGGILVEVASGQEAALRVVVAELVRISREAPSC